MVSLTVPMLSGKGLEVGGVMSQGTTDVPGGREAERLEKPSYRLEQEEAEEKHS
jgi:hypothetical protein